MELCVDRNTTHMLNSRSHVNHMSVTWMSHVLELSGLDPGGVQGVRTPFPK
jgi:hypothetical protein